MTPLEFLTSKGVQDLFEPLQSSPEGIILGKGSKLISVKLKITEEEYFNLREDRRLLRDKFEASGSFLEYSAIRKEIREIDEKLSEYEKDCE